MEFEVSDDLSAIFECSLLEEEVQVEAVSSNSNGSLSADGPTENTSEENHFSTNSNSTGDCPATAVRLPSFCKLEGNTGLHPSRNAFDFGVIKRLDNLFDDTAIEACEEERLKTFLRIRPSSALPMKASKDNKKKVLEIKDDSTVLTYPLQKTVNSFTRSRQHPGRDKKTEFKFTKVLGPQCSQTVVFEECVNPLIESFLRNENCLIFTYGATNSGKTYTLQGHGTDYGIIPRTLEAIFNRINDRLFTHGEIKPHLYQSFHHLTVREVEIIQQKKEEILMEAATIKNELMMLKENVSFSGSQSSSQGSTVNLAGVGAYSEVNYALYANTTMYSVWVSFAELYNEKVYDLLESCNVGKMKRRKERKLLQDKNGFVYIKDLTELHVTSDSEAYSVFLAGRKNLQFAATQMNQKSSRSHSFFTIRVVSIGIGQGLMPYPKTVHRMTFCDLAGMERASQTENEGARLKESSNINCSLTVLLKVIRLLREKQSHGNRIETIPFRESKLTHIFKSYLTSSTHICMIVNVNPDPKMADSTFQVLHNSAIASNVITFYPIEPEYKNLKEPNDARKLAKNISAKTRLAINDKENLDPSKISKPKTRAGQQQSKPDLNSSFSSQSDKNENLNNKKKVQFDGFFSSDTSSNSNENEEGQTVIATNKLLHQRVVQLEKENYELRLKLQKCEREKQQIREESVKMIAEQNRLFEQRYTEYRKCEENLGRRKLSLMQLPVSTPVLSPGSKCGRNYTPPRIYMDNIAEGGEEEEEEGSFEDEQVRSS